MTIKKILTAAATVAVLSLAGAASASADTWNGAAGDRYDNYRYQDSRGDRDDAYGWSRHHRHWRHEHRHFADRDAIFRSLRFHHIRYFGEPYFVRGHYVVRSYDHFGRVSFIEINPYTGGVIGVIRL